MSVCDPNSPECCEKCITGHSIKYREQADVAKSKDELEDLEDLLVEMKSIRIEARRLTRSGHPGVRAEGLASLAKAEDNIRWIKVQLAKENC